MNKTFLKFECFVKNISAGAAQVTTKANDSAVFVYFCLKQLKQIAI